MGLCRMLPEFWFGTGSCIFPSNCPFLVCGIHYLHFGIILFFCTSVLVLLVSYCTEPIDDQHVSDFLTSCAHGRECRWHWGDLYERAVRRSLPLEFVCVKSLISWIVVNYRSPHLLMCMQHIFSKMFKSYCILTYPTYQRHILTPQWLDRSNA